MLVGAIAAGVYAYIYLPETVSVIPQSKTWDALPVRVVVTGAQAAGAQLAGTSALAEPGQRRLHNLGHHQSADLGDRNDIDHRNEASGTRLAQGTMHFVTTASRPLTFRRELPSRPLVA